jgi:hypothetical protein
MHKIILAVLGGIVVLMAMVALVIAVVVSNKSNVPAQSQCATGIDQSHCNFVIVVRDINKYNDKTDATISTYGDELCTAMRNGGKSIVESMESPLIVSAAKNNLCEDVK